MRRTARHEYRPSTSVSMILIMLLLVLFLLPVSVQGESEEEDNSGEVIILENPVEVAELLSEQESQPFMTEDMDKTVFGKDGRVTVKNPKKYPYSAIAYMDVHAKCGCKWTGTGFMVNEDRLLTAAHCLVCPKHNKWADKITFYFGYKSKKNCAYKYTGQWTAYVGNTFPDKTYTTAYDYGCVKLKKKKVGNIVGWFGLRWNVSDSKLAKTTVYVAGYRDGLKYDKGHVTDTTSKHLLYKMDTQPGTSGGPIFDSEYYAVGINIAENNKNNIGYKLTDDVKECYNLLK